MSTYKQRHRDWTDPMSRKAVKETRVAVRAYKERNYIKQRLGGKLVLTPKHTPGTV